MMRLICICLISLLTAAGPATAQLGKSANRVLGQQNLRQNGLNSVEGAELLRPGGVAVDARGGETHLYVVDSSNHRVLGWRDATGLAAGAPADLVLGQPNLTQSTPFGIGSRGFNAPSSAAVDPISGDVYVSDSRNHRVLRFASPFENPSSVEPTAVFGQRSFTETRANFGGRSARTLNNPSGLAVDAFGNLWIADSSNHRVLRYSAATLESPEPEADVVLGQADFETGSTNGGMPRSAAGLNTPLDVDFDSQGALYVADASNARVMVYNAPFLSGEEAARVIGQADFETLVLSPTATASSLRAPNALGLGPSNRLYVTLAFEHRVLWFDNAPTVSGVADADGVLGQPLLTQDLPNTGTFPRASAMGLNTPSDAKVGPNGDVFVADSENHRLLVFDAGATAASRVVGQPDFAAVSPNRAGADSLGFVWDVVVDYSNESFPIYVSDTTNNRVLGWSSSLRFRDGAPADLVVGQGDFETTIANADTGRSESPNQRTLSSPRGLTLSDSGDLWVADAGNNRVVRFPAPFGQSSPAQSVRAEANLVLGQASFRQAISAAVSASSLSSPTDVELGPEGEIYVSDTGNNRVLEYSPSPPNGAAAIRVFGQPDFQSSVPASVASAQSLDTPEGLHVDDFGLLYVADRGTNRVLVFPIDPGAPVTSVTASTVIGQPTFGAGDARIGPKGLAAPRQVSTDSDGNIFIADSGNNRVVIYPPALFLPISDADADDVIGQADLGSNRINFNTPDGLATAEGLFSPVGLFADRNGTLYVGDVGNNRVVHFLRPAAAVSAATFLVGTGTAPGSLISLFGTGLSEETEQASAVPLPTELAGRVIEVNGELRAPLLFVSPGQANLQLPIASPGGPQRIAVRRADTDELLAGGPLVVTPSQPGLFTVSQDGSGQALALNQDGTLNSAAAPATVGSVVQLFGTGPGATNPTVADGEAAPAGPLAVTTAQPTSTAVDCIQPNSMCVQIGSKIGEVLFSGLAPGFVGLWQVNVRIPNTEDVLVGDAVPIQVLINRRPSNNVTIAIR